MYLYLKLQNNYSSNLSNIAVNASCRFYRDWFGSTSINYNCQLTLKTIGRHLWLLANNYKSHSVSFKLHNCHSVVISISQQWQNPNLKWICNCRPRVISIGWYNSVLSFATVGRPTVITIIWQVLTSKLTELVW